MYVFFRKLDAEEKVKFVLSRQIFAIFFVITIFQCLCQIRRTSLKLSRGTSKLFRLSGTTQTIQMTHIWFTQLIHLHRQLSLSQATQTKTNDFDSLSRLLLSSRRGNAVDASAQLLFTLMSTTLWICLIIKNYFTSPIWTIQQPLLAHSLVAIGLWLKKPHPRIGIPYITPPLCCFYVCFILSHYDMRK